MASTENHDSATEDSLHQSAAATNKTIAATSTPEVENPAAPVTTSSTAPAVPSLKLPHSSAENPINTPLDAPLESSKPKLRPALTEDQQSKYEKFLKVVSDWTELPTGLTKGASLAPVTDDERMFMTKECLLRYLRADKWNLQHAETRMKNTLSWRREYGLYNKITADYISVEFETGKQLPFGWDNEGRTCLYLRPSKQNTERTDRQIEALVYMLERSIDLMPPGQETLALLINFAETKSGQGATLSQGKQTLYILQNHYPERLGRALVTNVPFMIWGFFKLITPFIDPLTREKIKFNEDMGLHVPREQLLKESGGDVEFDYNHSSFWPALVQLCDAKRQAYRERWESSGKRIGESEFYLRGGEEGSTSEQTTHVDSDAKPL